MAMNLAHLARFALPAALVLTVVGCEDPAKNKPVATVSSAAPTPVPDAFPAGSGETLAVDAASSSVGFVGSKVTGKHEGKFEKFTGAITLVNGKAEGGRVSFDADAASVKTDDPQLEVHLKTKDFFDVATFPKVTFTSSEIKAGAAGGATHTVTGEMSFHGVKKTISFPATILVGPEAVTGTAEFVVKRQAFGIVYPGHADDAIRDEVVIKLSLKAPRKKG